MPVDTPHAEYTALINVWRMVRDVVGGSRFVKAAGRTYLPLLDEQNPSDYEKYKERATFFNATQRTVNGLHGLIFAKEPIIEAPSKLDPIIKDATLQGTTFIDYCKDIVREQLTVGRGGTLVDFNDDEQRPYCVNYGAENILNWKTMRVKGQVMLSLLVLFEYDSEYIPMPGISQGKMPDEFDTTQYEQWRVYKLNDDGNGNAFVSCQVFRRAQRTQTPHRKNLSLPGTGSPQLTGRDFVVVQDLTPTRRAKTLNQIPFVFHGSENGLPECNKPLMEDLCEINLSHYRTSADLENGLHISGCPTPVVTGHEQQEDDDIMSIGSTTCWTFKDPNAKAFYLEVQSEFGALRNALQDKRADMAALGARMLDPQKAGVEAADTHRLRQSSETATLTNVALVGSATLTTVLQWLYWWISTEETVQGITEEVCDLDLNLDFLDESVDPVLFQQMLAALVAGKISYEVWFNFLQKGEIMDAGVTMEEEQAKINEDKITMPPPAPINPDPNAPPAVDKNGKKLPKAKTKNQPVPPTPPPTKPPQDGH